MNSRNFATAIVMLTLWVSSVVMSGQSNAANRPNVVFIISDDQSWDSFGFMGGKVHTPRLNQMAKDGLLLRNFNVTSTVCSPSRYSFLTGRYAGRCEGDKFMKEHPPGDQTQVENIGELEQHRWNLAKVLQQNGYKTGFVGKSHIVRHDLLQTNRKANTADAIGWPQDADPREPKINSLMQANHQRWCDEIRKYGFDFADGVYAANLKELHCDALNVHNLDWTVDNALEFMDSTDGQPFFLCVSTTLHHGPAPWVNRFSLDADPRMTGEGFVAKGFDVLPSREDVLKQNREAGFKDNKAFAFWLDLGVGAIVDKVQKLGIAEDTLIVFVPDHGSYQHGKTTLYEHGMRVPMVCYWPGTIAAGSNYDGLTANIDFAPTVLDLCDVDPPNDYQIDGRSFRSVLQGSQKPLRRVLFGEMGHSRGVKTDEWKYIAIRYPPDVQQKIDRGQKFNAFAGQPSLKRPYLTRNGHLGHYASAANPHYFESDQLYNLKSDPEENTNVFAEHPDVADRMKRLLSKELRQFENRPFGEFTVAQITSGVEEEKPTVATLREVDCSTLKGKVMCGYQGWFNCNGDGMNRNWTHWSSDRKRDSFGPGNATVDLWPDVSELSKNELYPTGFRNADGSVANVFSSANGKTVSRHFQWMQQYGIDGAFVQRFVTGLRNKNDRANKDLVLSHARHGAEKHGRAFALMYDLSGLKNGDLDQVIEDWRSVQSEKNVTSSKSYLHHKGKPLVAVWGIGFTDRHTPGNYTLKACRQMILSLKAEGLSVMLGVPTGWREQNRDSVKDRELHEILKMADVLSPWTPGRYRNPKEVRRHERDCWRPDVKWCDDSDLDYLPVVFPGFSWHNLTKGDSPLDQIPRLKGKFLWSQIVAAKRSGAEMLYVAMFDEVDEATAIFKCTNQPPVGDNVNFLTYEGLPSDFYLKLVGQAGKVLRDEIPATDEIPGVLLVP